MKRLAAFTSVLSLTLVACLGAVTEPDPCLSGNHLTLDHADRSTAVLIKPGDKARTDENLSKGWYRFTSGAGGEIPTSAPKNGACSSKKPIWINGTQPVLDGQIHTLEMCYFLGDFDPCGIQLQIRAKRCLKNIVYELVSTSAANSTQVVTGGTYCAGNQVLCPPGQSSLTGFTPGCYIAPTVSDKPTIAVDALTDTFEFICELHNPQPQALYKLIWHIDGDLVKEEELQIGQAISKLAEQDLLSTRKDVLGRNLTCSARGRYLNEAAHKWGAAKVSDAFFMGIEVSDASGVALQLQSWTLTLPESEEHQIFSIRSTIPLRCDPYYHMAGTECKIDIAIRNDNSMEKKPLRCRSGVIEQLKLARCSVTITPHTWDIPQPIAIKATKDFKYDGNRPRTIEFQMTDGPGRSIWDGYVPHNIQVVTEDFIDKRAQCASVNDPHMTTFDGHKWHNYFEGEFVLYRHTELPFELRAFYKRCGGASCNCAVAAKAGDDVIIIDRCNSMGDIKIWGEDKKVEFNLLRTRTISTDDIISPNFKIFALNGGKEYKIYFPHGAVLRAQLTGGGHAQFMNLWLSPSPADFNRTEGMCGNFNGDKTDDLRWRNGTKYTGAGSANNQHPKEFSKHWRVSEGESIYNGQVAATESTYQKQYCSCVKGPSTAFEYLDCQLNSDSARCDQSGEDITQKNFEYQAVNSKRVKETFKFDPDWNPPPLDWPTPSGWTKANATKFCEDFLMNSQAFKRCNMTIDDDIEMCVEDIKMSDGIEFALTALESLKERCLAEWSKDPNANIPDDAFCFNECSGNGDCVAGSCLCYTGFVGEDCSLSKSAIPDVFFAPFCDVASEVCDTAEIYGNGFVKSDELTCTFQPAEIVEGNVMMKGAKQKAQASYENFASVKCPVAKGRSKRSVNGGAKGSSPGQLALSVTNTPGSQSNKFVIYTAYDSRCQTCDLKTGECPVKPDMCLIEGNCYKHGDRAPQDSDAWCDSSYSQSTWYKENVLPHWAIGVIAASASLAVMGFGIVIYMKVIRKRTKVIA